MIALKLLLSLLITVCGLHLTSFYANRKHFFKELLCFCNSLENNISYRQDDILTIIQNYQSKNSVLNDLLESYLAYLLHRNQKMIFDARILTKEENDFIGDFFSNIGLSNVDGQIELIHNFKDEICRVIEKCDLECATKGKLYSSLSIIVGGFVFILII